MSKNIQILLFLTLTLLLTPTLSDPQPTQTIDPQAQAQQASMKRTACLVLSRYHSNTKTQEINQIIQQLEPELQQKYINKMYATAVEYCMPKIAMDEAQKFFIEDPTFDPSEMFYIYEGFDYTNVDVNVALTRAQEGLVKFIKNFDEEMAVRREEKQAQKDVNEEQSFDMKFFGISSSDVPSSAKFVYFLIFAAAVSGAIWYLMSKIDDGKSKKQKSKKKKSPGKDAKETASPNKIKKN